MYAPAPATPQRKGDKNPSVGLPAAAPEGLARLHRALGPLVTVLVSTGVLVQAMRLWEWRPGTPLGLNGDNASVTVWVRTIIEYGPYSDNPDLGAPFAQNLGWFPTGDDVHFAILWLLGRISQDAFTVTALYFFIGFPLAGLTMYWLARTERLSVATSVIVGVLFAAFPGHQLRYAHLFLAAYWVVPFGAWVALRLFRGRSVFLPTEEDGWGMRRPRLWLWRSTGILVLIGLGGAYYVVFALILICAALTLRLIGEYRREHLYGGLAVIGTVAGLAVASLLGMHSRTLNDQVIGSPPLARSAAESELFGGKILDLVLPSPDHRVSALGHIARSYDAATQTTFEPSSMGFVAVVGCAVALLVVLTTMVARHPWSRRQPELWAYGVLALVSLAFYTKDGLGALFALFVAPEIRTWLRLYVVIGMFGLLAVGHLLTMLGRRRGPRWVVAVGSVVLIVGILDQTNPGVAPDYDANRQRLAAVSSLTTRLEAELQPGCAVFQVPVVRFPGSAPVARLTDYDLELPYLASSHLRWSYGAVGGTAQMEWQTRLPADPPTMFDDLAAAGFCAFQVDTFGYDDPSPLLARTAAELGPAMATSSDGRLVAFDLRPRRADLVERSGAATVQARGDRVLNPFGHGATAG